MSFSFDSLLKESLTVGHGLAAATGAYLHKAYTYLKTEAQKGEAAASKIVVDIKKDL